MIWRQIVTDKDLLKLHQDANGTPYIGVTKNGKQYVWQDRPVCIAPETSKRLFFESGLSEEIYNSVVESKGLLVLPEPEPVVQIPEPEPAPAVAEVPASPTLEEVKRDLDNLKREFDAWVQETTKAIQELNEKIL